MAYKDDIDALNPEHRWDFDGDALDQVGSVNGTATGVIYTSAGLCKGVTKCMETNGSADRVSFATTADINNSAMARHAVGFWFAATGIQTPPRIIYHEGTYLTGFQFVMAYGNTVMLEAVEPTNFDLQVISSRPLSPNRIFHLCGIFEGSGYGNLLRFYLDGVKQPLAVPVVPAPNTASLNARGVAAFGDPITGTTGLGEQPLTIGSGINFKYNEGATWGDTVNAELTDAKVRVELFEKGVLGTIVIAAGTQAVMQADLDTYADDILGDEPCNIEVETVTGDGNLTLTSDNITHDALASIHVKYLGTGELTWVNTNGADASIGAAPFGTIVIENPAILTVNFTQSGSEVRIYDDNGSGNSLGDNLDGIESSAGTSFVFSHSGASNDIAVQILKDGFQEILFFLQVSSQNQILNFTQKVAVNE